MCAFFYAHNFSFHAHPCLNRAHRMFVYFVSPKILHPLSAPNSTGCPLCPLLAATPWTPLGAPLQSPVFRVLVLPHFAPSSAVYATAQPVISVTMFSDIISTELLCNSCHLWYRRKTPSDTDYETIDTSIDNYEIPNVNPADEYKPYQHMREGTVW